MFDKKAAFFNLAVFLLFATLMGQGAGLGIQLVLQLLLLASETLLAQCRHIEH